MIVYYLLFYIIIINGVDSQVLGKVPSSVRLELFNLVGEDLKDDDFGIYSGYTEDLNLRKWFLDARGASVYYICDGVKSKADLEELTKKYSFYNKYWCGNVIDILITKIKSLNSGIHQFKYKSYDFDTSKKTSGYIMFNSDGNIYFLLIVGAKVGYGPIKEGYNETKGLNALSYDLQKWMRDELKNHKDKLLLEIEREKKEQGETLIVYQDQLKTDTLNQLYELCPGDWMEYKKVVYNLRKYLGKFLREDYSYISFLTSPENFNEIISKYNLPEGIKIQLEAIAFSKKGFSYDKVSFKLSDFSNDKDNYKYSDFESINGIVKKDQDKIYFTFVKGNFRGQIKRVNYRCGTDRIATGANSYWPVPICNENLHLTDSMENSLKELVKKLIYLKINNSLAWIRSSIIVIDETSKIYSPNNQYGLIIGKDSRIYIGPAEDPTQNSKCILGKSNPIEKGPYSLVIPKVLNDFFLSAADIYGNRVWGIKIINSYANPLKAFFSNEGILSFMSPDDRIVYDTKKCIS